MKRSQAINIGLTKLPPIRALKQAILAMDSAVIDREGIDVSIITGGHATLSVNLPGMRSYREVHHFVVGEVLCL